MWYEIVLDADDNGPFLVTVPAFPEIATFGENELDALPRARDAIEEAIAARIAEGERSSEVDKGGAAVEGEASLADVP